MFLFGNMQTVELLHELPVSVNSRHGDRADLILLCIGASGDLKELVVHQWSNGPTVPSQAAGEWPQLGGEEQSPQERRDSEVGADG